MTLIFGRMNSNKIFEMALGLDSPWVVEKTEFKETSTGNELHIVIGYTSGYFVDQSGKSTVHDRVTRKWRHLNFFEHECYIHCEVPRTKDTEGKKPKRVEVSIDVVLTPQLTDLLTSLLLEVDPP